MYTYLAIISLLYQSLRVLGRLYSQILHSCSDLFLKVIQHLLSCLDLFLQLGCQSLSLYQAKHFIKSHVDIQCESTMASGPQGGGRTSSKSHVKKKLHSILRYAESSRGLNNHSIQVCRGIDGDQRLEHFCSKSRTSLHFQKVGEIPGYG